MVAYDTNVSREYLGDLGTYASPLGDVEALVQALRTLLDDPDAARQLGSKLRERARQHFSWEGTGSALMRIYQEQWKKR